VELYELGSDPHEINNLAYISVYQDRLKTLSEAMDDWIVITGDMSAVPELEMVAKMWPGGKQPITTAPIACSASGRVTWTSITDGASIGLQMLRTRWVGTFIRALTPLRIGLLLKP